jgi:hypothetical protein
VIQLQHRVSCQVRGPISPGLLESYAHAVVREARRHGWWDLSDPNPPLSSMPHCVDPQTDVVTVFVEWNVAAL